METTVQRGEAQNVSESREAKVKQLSSEVEKDLKHWDYAFKRMKQWRKFARGLQWHGARKEDGANPDRDYTANITLRHIKGQVDQTYARNPRFTFRRSKRVNYQFWDGTAQQLQTAMMMVQSGNDITGLNQNIIQEAMSGQAEANAINKTGETLSVLYEYQVREQEPFTKKMMKRTVFSARTNGAAYIKQTFQRATELNPADQRALSDTLEQLSKLERLSADLADGEIDPNEQEAETLKLMASELSNREHIIVREGLAFDYPDSANIIPSRDMTYLPGFIGCSYVTEQFILSTQRIQEIYGVDVRGSYTAYDKDQSVNELAPSRPSEAQHGYGRVWEIWHKEDNLIYTICEGHNDFLREPHAPEVYTERFWPWFVYAPNWTDDTDDPFPPSDVELIQCQQQEINRSGEGLREHRKAARPGHVTGGNVPEEDAKKLGSRTAHDVVPLKGMPEDGDVRKYLQPIPTNPIDMNLYNTGPFFTDIQRASGTQEANLGGTSGDTATESSIAESSRQTSRTSDVDELDEMMSEMARAGGQILLQEMSEEQVKRICGNGAVWPQGDRQQIAREIYLEVVAGSSGRPNQAQQVQTAERVFPLLFQIPGLKIEKMGQHLLNILDDSISYEDWVDTDAMSVLATNGGQQAAANAGMGGEQNAPSVPGVQPGGPSGPGQQG
jgi:hypothetical protein